MAPRMKYPPGTLLQYTPKALKRQSNVISADRILVVVDSTGMYEGDSSTGYLNILNYYKTQDCYVELYRGPNVKLWTTEKDICFEFTNRDQEQCREFCRENNIEIR